MHFSSILPVTRLGLMMILFGFVGCGGGESTAPKKDLTDKEKQQIKELNEQARVRMGFDEAKVRRTTPTQIILRCGQSPSSVLARLLIVSHSLAYFG